jgi:hypothetical protein
MHEQEKCLSNEAKDLLLWAAQNGAFLSDASQEDFKTLCQLVDSGHLFKGHPLNDSTEDLSRVAVSDSTSEAYYSITKKGFAILQCNFLWNVYDEASAHPIVVAHVNECKVECDQNCLHHHKQLVSEPIKIFKKES